MFVTTINWTGNWPQIELLGGKQMCVFLMGLMAVVTVSCLSYGANEGLFFIVHTLVRVCNLILSPGWPSYM